MVAREALSARLDGEREPVPSARVDEHLRDCPDCTTWYDRAGVQALQLRDLANTGLIGTVHTPGRRTSALTELWQRLSQRVMTTAIVVIGTVQVGLAVAQAAGTNFGMVAAHHGSASGAHLLNESTAWSAALGIATIAMAFRRRIAPGLACVLVIYCGFLAYYVVSDALVGQVTPVRVVSHVPVALAAIVSVWASRTQRPRDPSPRARGDDEPGPTASRRRHLRAADDPAA
ncbi:zf-HC2 domain-containing protein [Mycobacterium sp. NPDC050441]|uniref:zf-HC2 domain-containing protein n=1 Tax=Mycobacterium sp. NPDC050441 TaxID=3155403 RepID=UPI0033C713B1